jgi:hypothetical protein
VVKLSQEERERLEAVISSGKRSAQLITKARILLKADTSDAGEGWTDRAIAAALNTGVDTVGSARRQLVEEGFEATLARKIQSELRPAANFRRRDGGQTDRPGPFAGSGGLRALEPTVARREGRRTQRRATTRSDAL